MRKPAAEFFGTFALVFCGAGAIVIDQETHGGVTHAGVALTFGLVVLAMIYGIGDVSGAHLNPAVSIGFAAAGRFPWRAVPGYAAAQVAGALLASALLRLLFPLNAGLGGTLPSGSAGQSVVLEVILTFLLMSVILGVSTGGRERGAMAGAAIGAVVALEALFAGPVCGASMNPARSLAPAAVSGHWADLWIYLTAPVLGALLAAPVCRGMRGRECCSTPDLSPGAEATVPK